MFICLFCQKRINNLTEMTMIGFGAIYHSKCWELQAKSNKARAKEQTRERTSAETV